MSSMDGQVAFVTGGAQGIGKAFSEALLKHGAKVVVADVNPVQGETTVKEQKKQYGDDRVIFVKCDVTSAVDLENAFKVAKATFGGLDIVCNNAGISGEENWERMIQVNLTAVVRGTMLGIEHMRRDKGGNGGVIVNTASLAGLMPIALSPVYCATKSGVVGFTRSWADNPDCGTMDIKFHALCPAFVDTPMIQPKDGEVVDRQNLDKIQKAFGIMSPDYVADAFIQLVERKDSTGEVLALTLQKGLDWVQPSITKDSYFQ